MAMIENEMEKKVYKVENVYYDRKPFRVLKIGRSYRIPCNSFDKVAEWR